MKAILLSVVRDHIREKITNQPMPSHADERHTIKAPATPAGAENSDLYVRAYRPGGPLSVIKVTVHYYT